MREFVCRSYNSFKIIHLCHKFWCVTWFYCPWFSCWKEEGTFCLLHLTVHYFMRKVCFLHWLPKLPKIYLNGICCSFCHWQDSFLFCNCWDVKNNCDTNQNKLFMCVCVLCVCMCARAHVCITVLDYIYL